MLSSQRETLGENCENNNNNYNSLYLLGAYSMLGTVQNASICRIFHHLWFEVFPQLLSDVFNFFLTDSEIKS